MGDVSDRVSDILDAACRVIARRGTDGLRMSAVAREAGVSSALIHYYFATRADLLLRAFEHADEQADATIRRLTEHLPDAADRLECLLVAYAVDPDFRADWIMWVEMWRVAIFNELLRPLVATQNAAWVEQVADVIRAGWEDGSIPSSEIDPVDAAHRLTAMVDGLGLQVLTGMTDESRASQLIRDGMAVELNLTVPREASR
jgi:AcrR family transcriptional regulator